MPDKGMWLYPVEAYAPYHIEPSVIDVNSWVTTNSVKIVYTAVTTASCGDPVWLAWYRNLKTTLKAIGVKLYAAAGQIDWAEPPNVVDYVAPTWAVGALQLKESTTPGAIRLFDGVMLDVEPHTMWGGLPPTQAQMLNWLAMQSNVTGEVAQDYCNPAGSPRARAWFALPTWLNLYSITGAGMTFDRSLLTASDGISFMVSRDTVGPATGPYGSILSVSAAARTSALVVGRNYRLTLETINPWQDGVRVLEDYETYYDQSRSTKLSTDIVSITSNLGADVRYKGVDLHHFGSWKGLPA